MRRQLRFHDDALDEIRGAAEWYEGRRQGLGDEFLDSLYLRLMQLADTPSLGRGFPGADPTAPARRLLLARFPYVIVFVEVGEEIRVIAVMHARRQPGYWLDRLKL